MNYQECNVVMLPTEKATDGGVIKIIVECVGNNIGDLIIANRAEQGNKIFDAGVDSSFYKGIYQPQHLYITNPNEEIKEGDWCYTIEEEVDDEINIIDKPVICKFIKTIHKEYIEDHYTFGFYTGNTVTKETYYQFQKLDGTKFSVLELSYLKKIIATTDESLEPTNLYGNSGLFKTKLPRPSNEFLKKYCELGGIDKVLVWYNIPYGDEVGHPMHWGQIEKIKSKPIISSDNTISIKPIKESWSREEVIELFKKLQYEMAQQIIGNRSEDRIIPVDWIKENL